MTTEKRDDMTIDTKRLRELAEDAKHDGSWWDSWELGEVLVDINGSVEEIDAAKFIAATDPQTVLALLDEIERLREQTDSMQMANDMLRSAHRLDNQLLLDEIDRLRALAGTT